VTQKVPLKAKQTTGKRNDMSSASKDKNNNNKKNPSAEPS
jgi:hypothetical protein